MTLAPIPPAARFRAKPDVLVRELDGEAVLLDLATGRYFGLNAIGLRIFELLDGERSLAEIGARFCGEFAAPPEAMAADLVELVAELEREGLLLRID